MGASCRRKHVFAVLLAQLFMAAAGRAEDQSIYSPKAVTTDPSLSIYAPYPVSFQTPAEVTLRPTLTLNAFYLTDYVYRGVDYTHLSRAHGLDFLAEAQLSLATGDGMPGYFFSAATNYFDHDPESHWQMLRGEAGMDWKINQITAILSAEMEQYPDRERLSSAEVAGKLLWDDSHLWHREHPLLQPYVLAAYDYQINSGWYLETGISHDFVLADGLIITPLARVAYTSAWQRQFVFTVEEGTGWQHYDLGVAGKYSLNSLLNIPRGYGQWLLGASLYYTGHLADATVGNSLWWGSVSIGLIY